MGSDDRAHGGPWQRTASPRFPSAAVDGIIHLERPSQQQLAACGATPLPPAGSFVGIAYEDLKTQLAGLQDYQEISARLGATLRSPRDT